MPDNIIIIFAAQAHEKTNKNEKSGNLDQTIAYWG